MGLLNCYEYASIEAPVCANCICYMSRKAANLLAKELKIKPAPRKRKIFYGSDDETICFHSGIHTNPALKAGCKFYERSVQDEICDQS